MSNVHGMFMESKIKCECAPFNANGNRWFAQECYYCEQCHQIKCPLCLLSIPLNKTCYRCNLHTENSNDFTCKRCYSCPKCRQDLDCQTVLYTKNTAGELVKLKNRSYKVAGKLVTMKCSKCEYQCETPIETKPQGLTKMVKNYSKSANEKWFDELHKSIETTVELYFKNKKSNSIQAKADRKQNNLSFVQVINNAEVLSKPSSKQLSVNEQEYKCITCLGTIHSFDLTSMIPRVKTILPLNYKHTGQRSSEPIPVLLNFINVTDSPLTIQMMKPKTCVDQNNAEIIAFPLEPFVIPCAKAVEDVKSAPYKALKPEEINDLPTSLLPWHLSQFPELKTELTLQTKKRIRESQKWTFDASNIDDCAKVVEANSNWATVCAFLIAKKGRYSTLAFDLDLAVKKDDKVVSLREECLLKGLSFHI